MKAWLLGLTALISLAPAGNKIKEALIKDVTVHNCSVGSSCYGWTTGVEVKGMRFAEDTRVKMKQVGTNDEFEGSYQGGNGKTRIIMDFYNLPKCTDFEVMVFGSTGTASYPNPIKTVCI